MYILLWYNKTCGHTLEKKKMGSLPVQSLYIHKYIYYDVPKWTTIRSKCAFKLLHACTRWIRVRVYHNNGFFLRKKTILPPTKERNKSRYTEKKTNLSYSSLRFRNVKHYSAELFVRLKLGAYNSLMGLMIKNWNVYYIPHSGIP